MLAARAGDGSANPQGPYVPAQTPGAYQFTPPFDFAAFVNWGAVKPFAIGSGHQFRAAAPFALTDPGYTADFNEVKSLGEAGSTTRTADQTQIARFWLENTPMSWQRIAMKLAAGKRLDGWDQMRLDALLQVAEADAYVAAFDTKYFYSFCRPITAIRQAFLAYELSSKFWGFGLAHEAVTRVMSELVDCYRVHRLLAVLKAANHRSVRLLERLGFGGATAEGNTRDEVAGDELLMVRTIRNL